MSCGKGATTNPERTHNLNKPLPFNVVRLQVVATFSPMVIAMLATAK